MVEARPTRASFPRDTEYAIILPYHIMEGLMEGLTKPSGTEDRWVRRAAFGVAIAGTVLIIGLYTAWMIMFLPWSFNAKAGEILQKHYQAVIGLPAAAAVAFIIVVFLRQTEGPIEFEGLGFKLNGAAGQVVMWVICFLALAGAIKLVW
jgi:hypothetical protein